mmetsp:Transcript_39575/g.83038  ORF Transcript_39575/g.83038 Transcript_39575/m.83038 type:complete len:533 (+) Transcript_39575:54-1652(+)
MTTTAFALTVAAAALFPTDTRLIAPHLHHSSRSLTTNQFGPRSRTCILRQSDDSNLETSQVVLGAGNAQRAPVLARCVRFAASTSQRARVSLALPGGLEGPQRAALGSLLRRAGFHTEPRHVEELSAGFCNWVYLCEVDDASELQNQTGESFEVVSDPADSSEISAIISDDANATTLSTSSDELDTQSDSSDAAPAQPMGPGRRVAYVVAKIFSPLAKLRLTPAMRGAADALAAAHGLGPRVMYKNDEGMITDFVRGRTLTETDIHDKKAHKGVLKALAPKLAALHSVPLPSQEPPVLWHFMEEMLLQIKKGEAALPEGITPEQVSAEVARMRRRFDELQMPVVNGHGDLKPSNVMQREVCGGLVPDVAADADDVTFIDFELSGPHYRGYDLYKLFRTTPGKLSRRNMRSFLHEYLKPFRDGRPRGLNFLSARALLVAELNEIEAETLAFEPLTWLEAAVFFFFAMATYPAKAHEWQPLALDRWRCYLDSSEIVQPNGTATTALLAARAAKEAKPAQKRGRGQKYFNAVPAV